MSRCARRNQSRSLSSRVLAICTALATLVLLPTLVLAEGAHFKRSGDGFSGFYRVSDIPGGQRPSLQSVRMGPSALKFVGGVILQKDEVQTIPDDADLERMSVSLTQDRRLAMKAGDRAFIATVESWELRPLVEVAESDQPSMVSLLGVPKSEGERQWELTHDRVFFIEVHPALSDTLLGMQLVLADLALVDFGSFTEVRRVQELLKRDEPTLLVGSPRPTPKGDTLVFWNPPWASAAEQEAVLRLPKVDAQGYVIADDTIEYTLTVDDASAIASGAPFHQFWREQIKWSLRFDGDELVRVPEVVPTLLDDFNGVCRESGWALMAESPEIWDTVRRTGFWLAVFREAKRDDPAAWGAFRDAVRALPDPPKVETPRAWIPEAGN